MNTVVLADDHPLFRRGLRTMLDETGKYRIVAEAGNGLQAIRHCLDLSPELLILDLDMPELDGFGVLERLQREPRRPRTALLTLHNDEVYLARATELGAHGYVLKENAEEELLICLERLAAGRHYTTPALMCSDDAINAAQGIATLTPAEHRVLEWLPEYESSQEIANALGLSRRTVENHRARIVDKLGLRGPNALLRFALQHGSFLPRGRK